MFYKKWKNKIKKTGWKIDIKKYNQVANSNSSLIIIWEILLLKYWYYYKFEKIISIWSNIVLSYIVKLKYPDYVKLNKPLKDINM